MKRYFFLKISISIGILILFIFAISPNKKVLFKIEKTKSRVYWNCSRHKGLIQFVEGAIIYENEVPFRANFTIDMTSIVSTDIENKLIKGTLENTLKSEIFFDVKNFPKAYFESHKIIPLGEDKYNIIGDFILFDAGICHNFIGSIVNKKDSIHFKVESIIIDRTDWAIYYGSVNNPRPKEEEVSIVISDTIRIGVDIVLPILRK